MPCCNVTVNENFKCDKTACVCIPTNGKSCICVCANENGDFVKCSDCKCEDCKCDNPKCTCIVANGTNCECNCCDNERETRFRSNEYCDTYKNKPKSTCKKESLKLCEYYQNKDKKICRDCSKCCNNNSRFSSMSNTKSSSCKNDFTKKTSCGENCNEFKKLNYTCLSTGGKNCVCVCKNSKGDIVRCDDCKCAFDNCQCKCNNLYCICIDTRGASCICVSCDEAGNIKTRTCCVEKDARSCNKGCCGKNTNKTIEAKNITGLEYTCLKTGGKTCICVCKNADGDIIRCDDCKCAFDNCQCKCNNLNCTCIDTRGDSCICVSCDESGNIKRRNCCVEEDTKSCNNGCCVKKISKSREEKNIKAIEYTCLSTGGKPCICVCRNAEGDIIRCDDCKCGFDNCQCECNNFNCTCIDTRGARCICVSCDEAGNIKTRNCCVEEDAKSCNKRCCAKEINKTRDAKNIKKLEYTCLQTGGKPCICVCKNADGDIVRCDNCKCAFENCQCKCNNLNCTCIDTRGASCICVSCDEAGNIKTSNCCIEGEKSCIKGCCVKKTEIAAFVENCSSEQNNNWKSYVCICKNGIQERCDDCNYGFDYCQCNYNRCHRYTYTGTKGCRCFNACEGKREETLKRNDCCKYVDKEISCKRESSKSCQGFQRVDKKGYEERCKCCNNNN